MKYSFICLYFHNQLIYQTFIIHLSQLLCRGRVHQLVGLLHGDQFSHTCYCHVEVHGGEVTVLSMFNTVNRSMMSSEPSVCFNLWYTRRLTSSKSITPSPYIKTNISALLKLMFFPIFSDRDFVVP